MATQKLFPTLIYQSNLFREKQEWVKFKKSILVEIEDIAGLDLAGQEWSKENYRGGFTSYASANHLHRFSPAFQKIENHLDKHIAKFAKSLDWDLGGTKLKMTNCWVNVMGKGTQHSMHIHPLSALSGTVYISLPKNAPGLKFEDPRLVQFMNAPPRKEKARRENKNFFLATPREGDCILFESWTRHEVPHHLQQKPRISVSFNYAWGD